MYGQYFLKSLIWQFKRTIHGPGPFQIMSLNSPQPHKSWKIKSAIMLLNYLITNAYNLI